MLGRKEAVRAASPREERSRKARGPAASPCPRCVKGKPGGRADAAPPGRRPSKSRQRCSPLLDAKDGMPSEAACARCHRRTERSAWAAHSPRSARPAWLRSWGLLTSTFHWRIRYLGPFWRNAPPNTPPRPHPSAQSTAPGEAGSEFCHKPPISTSVMKGKVL